MAGTKAGGLAAAATNKAKYGEDFYRRIGTEQWLDPEKRRNHKPGGFYVRRDVARIAGAKGGRISRRTKFV